MRLDLNIHKHPRDRVAHPFKKLLEKRKRLALVFLLGVFLGIAAQMNSLTQMIEGSQVLAPALVDRLNNDGALKVSKGLATNPLPLFFVDTVGRLNSQVGKALVVKLVLLIDQFF